MEPYFLDTNIFVYSFDATEPVKRGIAMALIDAGLKSGKGCISHQVIQEFMNVAMGRFASPLRAEDTLEYVRRIMVPMWAVHSSLDLIETSFELRRRWTISVYDSLIVAAALESRCGILYTEDLSHGLEFSTMSNARIKVVNPFR